MNYEHTSPATVDLIRAVPHASFIIVKVIIRCLFSTLVALPSLELPPWILRDGRMQCSSCKSPGCSWGCGPLGCWDWDGTDSTGPPWLMTGTSRMVIDGGSAMMHDARAGAGLPSPRGFMTTIPHFVRG